MDIEVEAERLGSNVYGVLELLEVYPFWVEVSEAQFSRAYLWCTENYGPKAIWGFPNFLVLMIHGTDVKRHLCSNNVI